MKQAQFIIVAAAFILSLIVASCGGGGGGTAPAPAVNTWDNAMWDSSTWGP